MNKQLDILIKNDNLKHISEAVGIESDQYTL